LLAALAALVLIAFGAWAYNSSQGLSNVWARGFQGVAAVSVIGAIALALLIGQTRPTLTNADVTSSAGAETFTDQKLNALLASGEPVFVNMTAAWCITCLVNERTTLSTESVQQAFRAAGITYLKGDWTNRDAEIGAYLRSFNRDGLPFYAFYPAGGRDPLVLPPVLTETIVTGEIERAGKAASVFPQTTR
jgi:thiol:disulfide interchange protein DsbD